MTLFIRRLPATRDRPPCLEVQTAVPHPEFIEALKQVIKPKHREWNQAVGVWRIEALSAYLAWLTQEAPLYFEAAFLIEGHVTTNLLTGACTEQLTLF